MTSRSRLHPGPVAAGALVLLLAVPVGGQAAPQGGATAPAQASGNLTLESILVSLERAAGVAKLSSQAPAVSRQLDSLARDLRARPGATDLELAQLAAVVTRQKPDFASVARWNPEKARYATQPEFRDALLRLALIGNSSIVDRLREQQLSRAEINALMMPLDSLHTISLRMSQAWNEEKLRRFELKYGPEAPALNGAEVVLNYLGQWVRPLAPRADGAPSPYEAVAAYRTLEIALSEDADTARMVAAAHFGLRRYFWNPDWGTGNRVQRFLRPRHASAGVALLGPSEKPFVRAWGPGHRRGLFVGWGELHAAYVFEQPRRILVGTGKQLIPYAF